MDWWRGTPVEGAFKQMTDSGIEPEVEPRPTIPPPPEPQGRMIDFWKRDDLSYLEGIVDMAPMLTARVDMPDPLTRWWKATLLHLIAVAKEGARRQERLLEDTDTPQPGHEVEHETGDGPDAIGMRKVIDAACMYIHGGSDDDVRQINYMAWRETYKDVFGFFPSTLRGVSEPATPPHKYANVRYRMIEPVSLEGGNGRGKWLTFHECARALDRGWRDGKVAMDLDTMTERACTPEECRDISTASDDYSGSK
jgi:hypothetical protein